MHGRAFNFTNEVKNKILHVDAETLKNFGAVSEQTARQMSANVRKIINTDIGVGVTGIAGPGGGTADKPVGTVYISVSNADKTFVKRFNFKGTRTEIKNQSCDAALTMIKEFIN